jgi:hypothetical protein
MMKSVTDVASIPDLRDRLAAASALVRACETKAERLRTRRDIAILVMLRPFADAVASTNAKRAALRADLDAGTIDDEAYAYGLAVNRDQRHADLEAANVTIYPRDVYEMLGVSRNLVNRLLMRMPTAALPDMADPARVAKRAHAQMPEVEATLSAAREIRDTAALLLMSGEGENGEEFPPVSNADVARVTGLTTARIAQLRG